MLPPAEVSPGAMMFAPERTKRIAPRSTRNLGKMSGSAEGRAGQNVRVCAGESVLA